MSDVDMLSRLFGNLEVVFLSLGPGPELKERFRAAVHELVLCFLLSGRPDEQ